MSPISDTTILSSTGAGCNVIAHVVTQLPYAGLAVVSALLGYVALALSGSGLLGLVITLVALVACVTLLRWRLVPLADEVGAESQVSRDAAS